MKKMKRTLSIILAVLMLVALFAGCATAGKEEPVVEKEATSEPEKEAAPDEEKHQAYDDGVIKVGLNIGKPDREFPQRVEQGVRKACEERGWELIVTYGGDEKVIDNARTLLAQDVDFIYDFGVNAEAGTAATDLAAEKNVPVFGIDVQYNGAYFFGADNAMAGQKLGESMAEFAKEKFGGEFESVVCFFPEQTGPVVRLRIEKAIEAIKDAGVPIGEEVWFDTFEVEKINTQMADYLAANPEKTKIGVLSLAAVAGPGVMSRFEIADRMDHGIVGTHNVSSAYLENVKNPDSIWVSTVSYSPNLYGEYLCKMAETLLAGEELETVTTMDHEAVTADNVDTFDFGF